MRIKIALPKGPLQESTADLLKEAGIDLGDYREGARSYRLRCEAFPDLFFKVFHEKDIAIQVAIGNYDLGICRLDWVEELLSKYHSDAAVKVRDLGYGKRTIYAVTARTSAMCSLEAIKNRLDNVRFVSEYPNLAEAFALKQRLKKFQIFPVWGSAAVYPPEDADLAIMAETSKDKLNEQGLVAVATILQSGACLVANKDSLKRKDLSRILTVVSANRGASPDVKDGATVDACPKARAVKKDGSTVTLALPDGHQQKHVVAFLDKVGLKIEGYNIGKATPIPKSPFNGVAVKVIRPQDMPQQVANGNFDLAITGRDWLRDHLSRFPSSPVEELLELGFGKVKIVAVVSNDMPVSSTEDLAKIKWDKPLRVAAEYVNIADKYAQDNRLAPYKIVPTWGATEAFLPEDADVLIENTETGSTIARNNLKIIETLFESTACLIGNTGAVKRPEKKEGIAKLVEIIAGGFE